MKGGSKDKTLVPFKEKQDQDPIQQTTQDKRLEGTNKKEKPVEDKVVTSSRNSNESDAGTDGHDHSPNGKKVDSIASWDLTKSIPNANKKENDVEINSVSAQAVDLDTPMAEAPFTSEKNGLSGMGEKINQEDLDGALLDGALDDYDDLDQDTEDTEVGNGEDDFSDDDDDDDDDDGFSNPSDRINSAGKPNMNNVKLEDHDMDTADEGTDQDHKSSIAAHSEDSDSDLPELEESDNEHEDEEDDGDADGEGADGDDEEPEDEDDNDEPAKKVNEVRKETSFTQKPVLNRPSAADELKDSGDDLSDLSEFDDTDDSDEDDHMLEVKSVNKESIANIPATAPAMTAAGNAKQVTGGRKRPSQEPVKEVTKQGEVDTVKEEGKRDGENEEEGRKEGSNGRVRLNEKKISDVNEAHHTDKESGSEVPEEEEEEEKPADEEEEEDLETKQRHKDALEALTSIEIEFANLRDKMYEERMTELDREVEMINAGTHPELSSLMQEIEQKREQRLRFAGMGKKYLIDIAQSAYQVAEYRAHCTFQSARRTTRSDMVRALGKKQQMMMMELTLSSGTHKRNVIDDKATLVRARKMRRAEADELRVVVERCGFPTSSKLRPISNSELDNDFTAMGLARPVLPVNSTEQSTNSSYTLGHMPPSMPIPLSSMPSRSTSNTRWPNPMDHPPQNIPQPGSRPEVEIYLDGSRCMIDGIWYKPNDAVVVLDAAIGQYSAKYLYVATDEIILQRTDGSKTKLHLGLFRGRKLCMQPRQ
ncbi:Sds3-like-domain-containing protein [Lobosporangium transversale]|uniref:Sds3-like-domain-containing protein n=1 Tax=Lobosporangium transversale TaxID=64571 RepID=A0A1Y2G9Z4_9FUNG|nr:Sds3-like-domain-containing protein [Lobosporangium transversale]ORZ05171.1 Sds3-like-domain-containing protein [Lobosporangium transversale]|eukprot:XP_021876946.1 Sds3-like-domain-containing protein [Lobosporangium transversale]